MGRSLSTPDYVGQRSNGTGTFSEFHTVHGTPSLPESSGD